jgi:hypothetical protein
VELLGVGRVIVAISLAHLYYNPVGIDQPDAAPSWDKLIEAQWSEGNRDRVANPGKERVEVVRLKSYMSDDPCILRSIRHGSSERVGGDMEQFEVRVTPAEEHNLLSTERHYAGALETEPLLVEFFSRALIPAVERDMRPM